MSHTFARSGRRAPGKPYNYVEEQLLAESEPTRRARCPGGWSVRKSRTPSANRYFPTEHEAAESAARVAKRDGTPVYFHDPGGRVLHKESYRPDLAAPHQKA